MFMDPISLLLLVLFILFAIAGPWLALSGMRKLANPVPVFLPVLGAVVVLIITFWLSFSGILYGVDVLVGTLSIFSIMFLLVTLAVVIPYCWFWKPGRKREKWFTLSLLAFIGNFMTYFTILDGVRPDRPLPFFGSRFPGSGDLLDLIVSGSGLGEAVYTVHSPFYIFLMMTALWLDVLFLSTVYLGLLSVLPAPAAGQNE
jgi:CDP-diglyceride synthetase